MVGQINARFVQIENEPNRNGLVRCLEATCIGQCILAIFSCLSSCCYCSTRKKWQDHRVYLLNNEPAVGAPERELWERANRRVHYNLPGWRVPMAHPGANPPFGEHYEAPRMNVRRHVPAPVFTHAPAARPIRATLERPTQGFVQAPRVHYDASRSVIATIGNRPTELPAHLRGAGQGRIRVKY